MKKIIKKWIISGTIKTESPLVIGSGDSSQDTDVIIQKDEQNKPFIPASSIAGALRHIFLEELDLGENREYIEALFGYSKNNFSEENETEQNIITSSIFFNDIHIKGPYTIEIREGIKINAEKGVSESGFKFDYELLAKNAIFQFQMEIDQSETVKTESVLSFIKTLKYLLKNSMIEVGSKVTSGFGKIKLIEEKHQMFDFSEKADVIAWLFNKPSKDRGLSNIEKERNAIVFPYNLSKHNDFKITIGVALKTSLIVRSYSPNPEAPDMSSIASNNNHIIPGTTVKGVLRNRAEKIIRTISNLSEKENNIVIDSLFGCLQNSSNNAFSQKSRFLTEESYIAEETVCEMIQERNKIDRFTNETINTALFDEMPVWPKSDSYSKKLKTTEICFSVRNFKNWEAGLALLIMKDLMTEDIPFGGDKSIGRGIFSGLWTKIQFSNKEIYIQQNDKTTVKDNKEDLENFVECFNKRFKENLVN